MFKTCTSILTELGSYNYDVHLNLPRADEYRMLKPGGGAVTLEEAAFLMGVVWVTKPHVIVELGTSKGASSLVLAAAAKDIGLCSVFSVDKAKTAPETAYLSRQYELPLTYVSDLSMDFLRKFIVIESQKYLVFSDTEIAERPDEVNLVIEKFPKGTVVVVHDTSDLHPLGPMRLSEKVARPVVELPSPRGISILTV